jgi:hypothetical protein
LNAAKLITPWNSQLALSATSKKKAVILRDVMKLCPDELTPRLELARVRSTIEVTGHHANINMLHLSFLQGLDEEAGD